MRKVCLKLCNAKNFRTGNGYTTLLVIARQVYTCRQSSFIVLGCMQAVALLRQMNMEEHIIL